MPGFLTDQALSDRLDVILKPDDDKPRGDWWDDAITDCNAQAWSFIAGTLQDRGYTLDQVLLWGAGGRAYQAQVALWLLNERGRLDTGMAPGEQQQDPRPALTARDPTTGEFLLWVTKDDGTLVKPDDPQGTVTHGRLNTLDERFRDRRGCWKKW